METTDKSLKDRAIDFKGSDYVQVKDRVLYLAEHYAWRYEIYQDYEFFPDNKMRVVKTKLVIWESENHVENCVYEWLAQEIEWSSFINKTSALENACTSSLWRAIACLWIGVIDSFASINEIEKAENREKAEAIKEEVISKAKAWVFTKDITKEWPFIPNDLPWFNKQELEQLKINSEWAKSFNTSNELIEAVSTKYRVSKAMKQEIADFWATL